MQDQALKPLGLLLIQTLIVLLKELLHLKVLILKKKIQFNANQEKKESLWH